MERLSITFPVELRRQLDAEAKREKMGRSALIQKAVRVYLQLKKRSEASGLLAQAYDEMNEEARELLVDFSNLDTESLSHIR